MVPKPRPARRGYVILVIAVVVALYAGIAGLHWSFPRLAEVTAGVLLVSGAFQLRHRGINRQVKNRK